MKKFLYCLSFVFITLCLFSCKSKDVASEEVAVSEENVEKDEEQEEVVETEYKISDEELAKKEAVDKGFIGWIDTGKKNPLMEDGIVKINTNSRLGTFCIYAIDNNDKAHAVLSPLNEYTSSSFYLKVGKKVFKLAANKKIKTGTAELENGIRIAYDIKNVATVIVEMNVFPSIEGRNADSVKVTVEVINNGKRVENFSVKAILDTILGENGSFHFYNYEGIPIRNEVLFDSMKEDKWFVSKNDKASLQILVDGGDTTPVEFVSLANFKTLEKAKWLPTMQAYGAFDTVLSYNNSAVGLIWPEKRLYPNESYKTVFYLSLALDGMTPNGYRYVYELEAPEPEVKEESAADYMKAKDEEQKVLAEKKDAEKNLKKEFEKIDSSDSIVENKSEIVVESKIESENVQEPVPNIEFNVENISKDHLTQEYVNSLMERITDLEALGASANRGEILQLNAELDAILSILKR